MPTNPEGNNGDVICGKPLETKFNTLWFFLKKNANEHKTLRSGKKYAGASRPSCLLIQSGLHSSR